MRTLSLRSRAIVVSSVLAAWTLVGFACSNPEENPATTRQRGSDSGNNNNVTTTDGSTSPTGAAVCADFGGMAGVEQIAQAIINNVTLDCRVTVVVTNARNRDNRQAH